MINSRFKPAIVFTILFLILIPSGSSCQNSNNIKTSSPLYTDSAGYVGNIAAKTVFRIICVKKNRMGTGFLHKSRNILTAAHVVAACQPDEVIILLPDGSKTGITKIYSDDDLDIAALAPSNTIDGVPLPISVKNDISIGTQVSTWGFPGGYTGRYPMLSVGYLSGQDVIKTDSGKVIGRLVVNAAFNSGNSGGPLIERSRQVQ